MAIIKKYNPNNIFISNRLNNRLRTILECPLSIVETPTGYGKTTVVKEYLSKNNIKTIWFNIDSSDKLEFFNDFCKRIDSVSEKCARTMRSVGFPKDNDTAAVISKALFDLEFREKTILVLDNYHLICDEYFNHVIKDMSFGKNEKLCIVCLTQAITSGMTFDLILKKKLNYLSKSDFELTEDEIEDYYKLCGIKLDDDEADFLFQYTEGWISALYLQMLSYVATNKFEPTVSVDNLVCKAIWNNLNRKEQDCLISMSIFSNFSFRQMIEITGDIISESEIEALLDKNSFVKYDSKSRKYYIHSILKYFLEQEFDKQEPLFKKKIYKGAGNWFAANEEYFNAIRFYNKIGDYESILAMNYTGRIIVSEINHYNKKLFFEIVKNVSNELKIKYINTYLIFVFTLFLYNERDYFKNECELISRLLEEADIPEMQKKYYVGECELLKSFGCFNNLTEMEKQYNIAYSLLKAPSKIFDGNNSFTFFAPSVLGAVHTMVGKCDLELEAVENIMPLYYKLFDGSSAGAEAVCKAELLLNRGEFNDAAILCKKAIYMAETRNQPDMFIAAMFLMTRIAYFNADYIVINENLDKIKKNPESKNITDLEYMADMCEGYIRVSLDSPELVPSWLTDNISIEKNCKIQNLGFANIIYGKYLICKGKYDDFLAISGEMLGVSGIFENIMYKIYTYIYISIANSFVGRKEKAEKFLRDAIELAYFDKLMLPFVENYGLINTILIDINDVQYGAFLNNIKAMSKKYSKGLNASKKASINDQSFGLTSRELDVAKLAAKRFSNKEIADMLFIAESTVKSNLKVVFNKLGINSRNDLKNFFD